MSSTSHVGSSSAADDAASDDAASDAAASCPTADARLDAGQASCGELLILVVRAFRRLLPGQVLEVVGYDPGAREDIPAWCRLTRNHLLHVERCVPSRYFIQKPKES